MAEQVDRRVGRQFVNQGIKVAQIVGEPVGVGGVRQGGQAKAAPIGGDDLPVFGQCIDDELE